MKKKTIQRLTDKQKRFCEEYLIDLNATQAAIRAGYSEKTANRIASENLTKLDIQAYIQELNQARQERTQITADMVIQELGKVALINLDDFYYSNGTLKEPSQLSERAKCALASYSIKRINLGDGEFEDVPIHKTHDKMKALEMLGRHYGIFEKDNKQKPQDTEPKTIQITYEEIKN